MRQIFCKLLISKNREIVILDSTHSGFNDIVSVTKKQLLSKNCANINTYLSNCPRQKQSLVYRSRPPAHGSSDLWPRNDSSWRWLRVPARWRRTRQGSCLSTCLARWGADRRGLLFRRLLCGKGLSHLSTSSQTVDWRRKFWPLEMVLLIITRVG